MAGFSEGWHVAPPPSVSLFLSLALSLSHRFLSALTHHEPSQVVGRVAGVQRGVAQAEERRLASRVIDAWQVFSLSLFLSLNPLGPVDPSFRALSGRLKFTVRRHKFNKDSLSLSLSLSFSLSLALHTGRSQSLYTQAGLSHFTDGVTRGRCGRGWCVKRLRCFTDYS